VIGAVWGDANDKQIHEVNIFAWVLVVQSLPFLAAVAIADRGLALQPVRYWRTVEARSPRRCRDRLRSPDRRCCQATSASRRRNSAGQSAPKVDPRAKRRMMRGVS
jgi:hypothetical protein